MQSQISEISPVLVEVSVQVPWPDVEKAIEGNYVQLGRTAKVKGFRPGKVPRNVLKQLFGARVKQDVISNLVEAGLGRAVQQHNLAVVQVTPLEAMPELKQGEPLAFKAKLEVRPKIESVDIDGIQLTRQALNVSDDDVNQVIERMRQQNAEVKAVEPARSVGETDIVACDYQVSIEGTPRPDLSATDRDIDLSGTILPELKAGLVGKSVGDKAQIEVKFPSENGGEFAGKAGTFDLEVKAVKEKILPTVDDEFAKDLEYASLDELKQKTRAKLEETAKDRIEGELRDQLIDKLVEKNPLELPPSLVQQQHQAMLQEYVRMLRMTGQAPRGQENILETMRADAEKRVRAALLLGAVARLKEIKLDPKDVDARLTEMADRSGKHVAKLRAELQGEQREMLESQVLEEKLLEYLLGQATITESAT
jgi:trigger factor